MTNSQSIAEELNIFGGEFKTYQDISPAKKAWITIKAKKAKLNPEKIHSEIKSQFTKVSHKILCTDPIITLTISFSPSK